MSTIHIAHGKRPCASHISTRTPGGMRLQQCMSPPLYTALERAKYVSPRESYANLVMAVSEVRRQYAMTIMYDS